MSQDPSACKPFPANTQDVLITSGLIFKRMIMSLVSKFEQSLCPFFRR